MADDYHPISCAEHSRLELMAMHAEEATITCRDGLRITGKVSDVTTRDGAEFVVVTNDSGEPMSIRLDRIALIEEPDSNT